MPLNPLPLREILLCQVFRPAPPALLYAVVRRSGLEFELLSFIKGDHAALLPDETVLELLERRFQLPVRVLSGSEGAFLGLKTFLARQNGSSYALRRPPTP